MTPPVKKPKTAIPCSFTFHHSSLRPFMMCPMAIPRSVLAPVRWVVRTTEPLGERASEGGREGGR
jgi:hypothetical protein